MTQLILDTGIVGPLPRRPRIEDKAVEDEAMESLCEEVCDWLGRNVQQEVRSDLEACIDTDGYRFAKNLERRCSWEVDAKLVGILGSWDSHLRMAHLAAVAHWRAINRITEQGDHQS